MTLVQMINEAGLGNTPISIEQFKALATIIQEDERHRFAWELNRLHWKCEQARFVNGDGQHTQWYKGYDSCLSEIEAAIAEVK